MREYIDGSNAIVRGALAAGCTFFAGYPITPASGILSGMMRHLPAHGGTAIQGEDEIASIGMCIGATMTGARAMTATSGPGMSLYSENLGLAVVGEVPLVVVDVQRMGPGTGSATTVAQGDVQFARWGTSGGYPIIALAPSTLVECFTLTVQAFAFAERFRCPVFVLTDKEMAMTLATVEADAFPEPLVAHRPTAAAVRPYEYQPSAGVPPMQHFGGAATVRFTGSTHDEQAMITKDAPTMAALNQHLWAKIEDHLDEIEMVDADLDPGARTLVLGYGITAGAIRTAIGQARAAGRSVSSLVIQSLWPVPEMSIGKALVGIERVVVPELNLGQYRREIERLAGDREVVGVNRVDGNLISPDSILEMVR